MRRAAIAGLLFAGLAGSLVATASTPGCKKAEDCATARDNAQALRDGYHGCDPGLEYQCVVVRGQPKDCSGILTCDFSVNVAHQDAAERQTLEFVAESAACKLCVQPSCKGALATGAVCAPTPDAGAGKGVCVAVFDTGPDGGASEAGTAGGSAGSAGSAGGSGAGGEAGGSGGAGAGDGGAGSGAGGEAGGAGGSEAGGAGASGSGINAGGAGGAGGAAPAGGGGKAGSASPAGGGGKASGGKGGGA